MYRQPKTWPWVLLVLLALTTFSGSDMVMWACGVLLAFAPILSPWFAARIRPITLVARNRSSWSFWATYWLSRLHWLLGLLILPSALVAGLGMGLGWPVPLVAAIAFCPWAARYRYTGR